MSDTPSREEISDTIDRAVRDLLTNAGLDAPPLDLARLAQHLALPPLVAPKRGRAGVIAKVAETATTKAWLAAHAIGQHLRPDLLRRLGLDPEQPQALAASLPNLFADRLLVPTHWLSTLGRECGWDLLELEPRLRPAGHELIAWRMLDLAEPVAITILDDGSVIRRRSNAFRVGKTLSAPEERCRQVVRRDGEPHELRSEGWAVQGWPVGGRVILRSRRLDDLRENMEKTPLHGAVRERR
jgi:hypothetical protein